MTGDTRHGCGSLWETLPEQEEGISCLTFLTEPRVAVIGVGGLGCRCVSQLAADNPSDVELVAADTDMDALANCLAHRKVLLGEQAAAGQGTGGEPLIGKAAAMESAEEIRSICQGVEQLVLVCGLQGGTGAGAAPVIAEVAKEHGAVVIAVAPAQEGPCKLERPAPETPHGRLLENVHLLVLVEPVRAHAPGNAREPELETVLAAFVRALQPRACEESPLLRAIQAMPRGWARALVAEAGASQEFQTELAKTVWPEMVAEGAGVKGALLVHLEGYGQDLAQRAQQIAAAARAQLPEEVQLTVTHRQDGDGGTRFFGIACAMLLSTTEERESITPQAENDDSPVIEEEPLFEVREPEFVTKYRMLCSTETEPQTADEQPDFVQRLAHAVDAVLRDDGQPAVRELIRLCAADEARALESPEATHLLRAVHGMASRIVEEGRLFSRQEKALLGRVPPVVAAVSLKLETAVEPAQELTAEIDALLEEKISIVPHVDEASQELFAEESALELLAL
ncbi:MAG: hypothetical protein ONB25_01815 [candidate division KSB1 bacterium]|nr:hypothetical protein [candidate division KSB1 bacterium]